MPFEVEVTTASGATITAVIEETRPCGACDGTGWDGGEKPRTVKRLAAKRDVDDCFACGGLGVEVPEVN